MDVTRPLHLIVAALSAALAACGVRPPPPSPPQRTGCDFVVAIDAGSSGSRAYTYRVTAPTDDGRPPGVNQVSVAKVEPGISSFVGGPQGAGDSITALLSASGGPLTTIPKDCRSRTPTTLMATSGMRLVERHPGGESASQRIYAAVVDAVKRTGLDLRFAGTISGEREGIYAWLSVNYALGRLGGPSTTVGALDLGGASTQIAFTPVDPKGFQTTTVRVGKRSYDVYVHSYLGYGQDHARKSHGVDACFNPGHGDGKGSYAACSRALARVAEPARCEAAHCGLSEPDDLDKRGVPQPLLPRDMKFYAFGGYVYARKFFELSESATLEQLRIAAGGADGNVGFCATPWDQAREAHGDVPEKYLGATCFNAAWIDVLLTSMGFSQTSSAIVWTEKVGNADAGWTLGAALCVKTQCLAEAD